MRGFGIFPNGHGYAGTGSPDLAPIANNDIYTGGDALAFDTNGDTININGVMAGWSQIEQKVYLALRTLLDSSYVDGFGLPPFPLTMSTNLELRVQSNVSTCLADLVKTKQISIKSIDVLRGSNGRASVKVSWIDLGTQNTFGTAV